MILETHLGLLVTNTEELIACGVKGSAENRLVRGTGSARQMVTGTGSAPTPKRASLVVETN